MKLKLEKIERYIEEEIKPHCPVIVNKLCITDISPKKISKSNPIKESLLKPITVNRYQSVKKIQEIFYKPAYQIKSKKTILLFLTLSCSLHCVFAQQSVSRSPFTYEKYLEQEQQKKKIKEALKGRRFNESLKLAEQLNCFSLSCNEKYELMALSYFGMGNSKKGEKYLLLSVENGVNIQKIKHNILGIEFPTSQEKILKAHEKYLKIIDLELRKQLFDGYYEGKFPEMLDSLIAIGRFPGLQQTGHQLRCNLEIPQIMHHQVLLETADNEKFIDYYNRFVAECEQFNDSWKEVEDFIKMNMEKQLLENRVSSLDFIYLTSDNNIDVPKSLLQLVAITKIAKQSRFFITLHCSNLITQETWEKLIAQFKSEFHKMGNEYISITYDPLISDNSSVKSLFYLTTK